MANIAEIQEQETEHHIVQPCECDGVVGVRLVDKKRTWEKGVFIPLCASESALRAIGGITYKLREANA